MVFLQELIGKGLSKTFVLTWSHNGLETDQVMISVSTEKISLHYQQYLQGEDTLRQQHITIDYTPCHYGRQRPYLNDCLGTKQPVV